MNQNEILLKKTLSNVLGVGSDALDDDSSMDTISTWDSVKHLNLVLALEDAFSITFTEEQTMEIISYPLIKLVLAEHGVSFDI
ncbi:acyl carrier protein [Polynucleobacter sp. UB-Raua-W9]|uniref:acyl carrier protein n=1 Tax=Polynucleobacter sp. UB-Raua-W9 TaxID=1819736 RepID=UPI001BFDF1CC|nr:acyl carrier protein [Polynucleobacter sp. UB-Raua-W9]